MNKKSIWVLANILVLCFIRWFGSQILKQHYDPAVARMAGLFEQPFRPLPQDLEYYLTLAYPTVWGCAGKRSCVSVCSCVECSAVWPRLCRAPRCRCLSGR